LGKKTEGQESGLLFNNEFIDCGIGMGNMISGQLFETGRQIDKNTGLTLFNT
jgi:hypothetical protein